MTVMAGYAVVELLFFVVKVWALITAFKYPAWAWEESGHARGLWIALLVVSFFLPVIGFLIALWFVISTSTSIGRVAKLGRRPGFPGA